MTSKKLPCARHWKLTEILEESAVKGGMTLVDLADRLAVDVRTVRRDLDTMKKQGIPIQKKRKAHGLILYWLDENRLKPPEFKIDQAAALYLGYRFLTPFAHSHLGKEAKAGLNKIRKTLSTDSIRCLDRLLKIFLESTAGWSDYAGQSDIIFTLIVACENRKEIAIRYRSYAAKEAELYTIQPYALITRLGTLYVLGFSNKRNVVGIWKVNRIAEAEPLKTTFKRPKESEIDTWRRNGFGVFVFDNRPLQKVRIKADGPMARYVQEHHWHETQKFMQQADGSVIVQFEVVPTRELTNWILSLGCNAEVLQPKSLREQVAAEIVKMQQRYQ